jgi:glycosyltransferase involved in cell wall biosynthesis
LQAQAGEGSFAAMKVNFVTQPYDGVLPPNQNSIGLIVYNTALAMARDAQVTLYAKRRREAPPAADVPFRMSYVAAPTDELMQTVAGRYPRWARMLRLDALADAHPGYARAVRSRLDHDSPDIVHVMNYWGWSRQLRDNGGNGARRRRLVLEMQSEWLSQMDMRAVDAQLQAVDGIVAVSDHIARLVRTALPNYRGMVATAWNGVDVDIFQPAAQREPESDRAPSLLFVGRASPEKGVHTLLEAFALVVRRFGNARLDIAGPRTILPSRFLVELSSDPLVRALMRFYDGSTSSDYQRHLDELVVRLGLQQNVRFLGAIPHKQLVSAYQSADVVVNPSLSESFGISMVEAMACAVPAIGTKVGGMLETVVDRETGRLVDADQPEALAAAIIDVLSDPSDARRMGVNGRARAEQHFSWRARARGLLDTYRQLLDRAH